MTYLILDSNYLCHRAYHAMGDLQHKDIRTGMLFGFLRDITTLQDLFSTRSVVFCFDNGTSLRAQHLPTYKSRRKAKDKDLSHEEMNKKIELYYQIDQLRDIYLRRLGYNNVHHYPGYESDDIIAKLCMSSMRNEEKIIVSADADLYQCIDGNTRWYNPQKRLMMDKAKFNAEWGIQPSEWRHVKALAGCGSDDIVGIKGVGEKTAAKYLRGDLGLTSKAYQSIASPAGLATWKQNIKLVRLPYPGTPEYTLLPDNVTEAKWQAFADEFGMATLSQPGRAGKIRNGQGFGL